MPSELKRCFGRRFSHLGRKNVSFARSSLAMEQGRQYADAVKNLMKEGATMRGSVSMRGQFMTPDAIRLLILALFVYLLFCHPFRNKLYLPLSCGFVSVVFAFVDAAVGQHWTTVAVVVCFGFFIVSFPLQNLVIWNRRQKEETRGQGAEAHRGKKGRRKKK